MTSLASSADDARRVLAAMWTIRRFEEAVDELFARGLLYGTMHLSIGQEASATGACLALRDDDVITSTHRGHGHCIAKGADLGRMMAELLARDSGYCRGRGGSMHIADVSKGNLGANGIVAGGIPIAVGAGLALKLQGTDKVALSFFGDGATSEGAFHEASTWPPSGTCRWCSSARTTTTACRCRSRRCPGWTGWPTGPPATASPE